MVCFVSRYKPNKFNISKIMNEVGKPVKRAPRSADLPDTLGSRVKSLRHRKEWTLEQLANEAGVSKGFLSELENGRNQPSGRILMKLSRALDASVDYLLHGGESEQDERERSIDIPHDLAELAEEQGWSFSKVRALLSARHAVLARRSDKPRRTFTKTEWLEFAKVLDPFLSEEHE